MIFRLTLKLAKKIGIAPLPAISYDENRDPLMDWNADLFTVQRTQYIILTNTASLYSMVMHGRGITPGGHPKSPTCGHLKIPHPVTEKVINSQIFFA